MVDPDSVVRWQRERLRRYSGRLSKRPRIIGRPFGIYTGGGDTVTVTSNFIVNPGSIGIVAPGGAGSISANLVANAGNIGIVDQTDEVSVPSNKIVDSPTGISLQTSIAAIQANTITKSTIGIDFGCSADPNVHSNIITDAGTALNGVPRSIAPGNAYLNVGTIKTGC